MLNVLILVVLIQCTIHYVLVETRERPVVVASQFVRKKQFRNVVTVQYLPTDNTNSEDILLSSLLPRTTCSSFNNWIVNVQHNNEYLQRYPSLPCVSVKLDTATVVPSLVDKNRASTSSTENSVNPISKQFLSKPSRLAPTYAFESNNHYSSDTKNTLSNSADSYIEDDGFDLHDPTSLTESETIYPTVLIPKTQVHGCPSVESFFDLFLKNDAKYSIFEKFLQMQGDTNLKVEKWTGTSSSSGCIRSKPSPIYKRIVSYLHRIHVPMAPPHASARREQICHQYDPERGIILESKTYVNDMPVADCFYSAERMIITPGSVPNSITIAVDFGVTYLKKTMLKRIIAKQATQSLTNMYNNMLKYIEDALTEEKKKLVQGYDHIY